MTETISIRRSLIDRSPSQPRTDWGDLEGLAASIRAIGQTTPIKVRITGKRYELIEGERRFRAFDLLEREEIDAIIVAASDLDVVLAHLASNEGKPLTPLEEGRAYAHLETAHEMTVAAIADRVGRSISHVRSRLLLAGLVPAVQALLAAKRIGHASAALLSHLSNELQEEAADSLARLYPLATISTLQVRHAIERHTHALVRAPFDTALATLTERGPCIGCDDNTATQRDLFEETDSDATCLNVACWAEKVAAHVELVTKDATNAGVRIMDASETAKTLDLGRVRPGAQWVPLDEPLDPESADPLTWRDYEKQLAAADKDGQGYDLAKIAVAIDGGRDVWLIDRGYAAGFITRTHPRRAAQLRGEPDPDVAAAKEAKKEQKAKDAAEAEIDAACIAKLVEGVTAKVHPKTAQHLALMLLDIAGPTIAKQTALRRELDLEDGDKTLSPHEAVARCISTLDDHDLFALIVELAISAHLADESLGVKVTTSLLALYDIERKAVAKELKNAKRNVKTRRGAKSDAVEAPAE